MKYFTQIYFVISCLVFIKVYLFNKEVVGEYPFKIVYSTLWPISLIAEIINFFYKLDLRKIY